MNKSLLALAVLAAFAGAASAQSSVTVYGKVDVGGVLESGPAGKTAKVTSGVTGGSRLGFKGVEDLGGGLKAAFQLETGLCADSNAGATQTVSVTSTTGVKSTGSAGNANFCTGGNSFMGRQAHVDLSGNFGSVTAGRQYALAFVNLTTIDPFGTGLAGQTTNLFDGGNGFGNPRVNNSVIYTTPNISGFTAAGLFGAGETQGNWRTGRVTGAAATYASGPIYLGAAYAHRTGTDTALALQDVNFGGMYDFGVFKLHAIVQSTKTAPVATTATQSWQNARDVMVGVSAPVGNGTVMASYNGHNDRTALNRDANQFGVGSMYALSKRTSLYAAYARIANKNGAYYTVGNATEAGNGNRATNLGIVHNF